MLKHPKTLITCIASLGLLGLSSAVNAAPVSVGPYLMDTDNFASTLTSVSGSVISSTGTASAITDADLTTYVRSDSSGVINLGFGSNVGNGAGDDLALFFIGPSATVDVTIGEVTQNLGSNLLTYDDNGTTMKYMVAIGSNYYDLNAITLDASNFGMADGALINDVTIGLGSSQYLALVGGLNTVSTSPVPLPAPLMLLLSGLTALGLFTRRTA